MVSFFTLIPLLFATSANATNDLYPSYLYSVHLEFDGFVPSMPFGAYRSGATVVTPFFTTLEYHIKGDVYFSDDSQFYIPNLVGTLDVTFKSYDSVNDSYVVEDSFTFDLFDIEFLSSGGASLGISDTFTLLNNGSFYLRLQTVTPAGTTTNQDIQYHGSYITPTAQNPVSFRFDDSEVLQNINLLITNYVSNGYNMGFDNGYNTGYGNGINDGVAQGYQDGYTAGFTEANNQDATASVIFTGILEVALLPINVFLAIFNYEVFGINISGLVSALLTVAVVIIIIRVILAKSGGNGGSKS